MFSWEKVENVIPPKKLFVLPLLPKPHYQALKRLCKTLGADDWEVICSLIQFATEGWTQKAIKFDVIATLRDFRGTAPSEAELPLIDNIDSI